MSQALTPEMHTSPQTANAPTQAGLHIPRRFTSPGRHPFEDVRWERRRTVIANPDGSPVFSMEGVEVPADWSQLATDIVVSKYFRKAGVPGQPGHETSVRQVVHRLAHTIRTAGEQQGGYFASHEDAETFEAELAYMLVRQIGAFNSPVWFNCGLYHEYGIGGSGGSYAVDLATDTVQMTTDSYSRPQVSACFIQSVNDDLMSIFELVKNEARVFKYGSGCTSGDSRVFVEGEGFLQIRDLFRRYQEAGRPVREFDGTGRFIEVADLDLHTLSIDPTTGAYQRDRIDRVWSYEVASEDKLTVRFDTGAKAVVSAWHPFLVWDGSKIVERRADQLRRGDCLLGPNDTALRAMPVRKAEVTYDTKYFSSTESHRVAIDADLAWLCGYFMGDGSLGSCRRMTTSKYKTTYRYDGLRVRFHDETTEVLEHVQQIAERVFGETAAIQQDGRGSKGKHLAFTGRKTTGFFAALFDPGAKTHTLKMPSFVWESGEELVLAFLAGLVDSDGWVAEGRAHYATASRAFASEVATLANLYGLGGGAIPDRSVTKVTILHRSADTAKRQAFASRLAHPTRRQRLREYTPSHERKFCLPLGAELKTELFGEGHAPADWLKLPVGGETLHLGRLQYAGLINPKKLERGLALLDREDEVSELLARVAGSATFVTGVEPCLEDPDFYDLTVARNNNYLAGEHGLVVIHNTGTNFSKLRGRMEKLSGGGTSSGLMSFLEVLDRGAGATKSGGTTRRAAKMVVLDMDHPEIVDFIHWKVREERKVAALVSAGYSSDFNGEAYATVAGQNSNNSVRVPDTFMQAVERDTEWSTRLRTNGEVYETFQARKLWHDIADAAWACADPGVQFDDTIQKWHTCKNTDRIHATNPCVTGDTLVATADGWQRIDSLVGTTPLVVGLDGKFYPAARVIPTGTKQVFRVRTVAGYEVRITEDHLVWTGSRDVAVRDLEAGDTICLRGTAEAAVAVGQLIGDVLRQESLVLAGMGPDPWAPTANDHDDFAGLFDRADGACLFTERFRGLEGTTASAVIAGIMLQATLKRRSGVARRVLRTSEHACVKEIQSKLRAVGVEGLLERVDGASEFSVSAGDVDRLREQSRGRLLGDMVSTPVHFETIASIDSLGEEPVYDLTEPVTSHFVANGLVVHNCSEFVFLDDTACNLASINLMKFRRDDGSFDIEGYKYANRVFFLAQEILVSFASYPTERIARSSEDYRPLGLGYANLGTLLMVEGLPYDSDAARTYAACVTAIMTGEAYALSAEMASSKGAFRGYEKNRDSMLGVMRLHREAARAIDPTLAPRDMRSAAIEAWDRAVAFGGLHGYRNAQASVLAPTGTIGLLMDCDTTGVEPDFALVKFKKLAGGGYFKIVNQSVPNALKRLGYDSQEIERISRYAVGYGTLQGAPHINDSSLTTKGFSEQELAAIERTLPNVLDIRQAFGRGILSDDTLTRLGVSMAEREKPGFNVLPFLGFTDVQIDEANLYVCGTQTVEGAPGLKPEHLPVFDCANRCGTTGTRFIRPIGHVRMMGAVQPFISGAISKTVNLPNEASVDDVAGIYTESWKLGLKAVALYRDGCKLSQPLASGGKKKPVESAAAAAEGAAPAKLHRRRLPRRRHGFTQEARIAGHKVFLRTGEYEDGGLGEIFIDMHKEGAAFRSMMNCFAIAVSMGLQYGVPLEDLVDQFCFTRFEPHGRVEGHDNIKVSTSVIDYVFRVLGYEYLNRTDLAHVIDEAPQGQLLRRPHATDMPVGKEHRGGNASASGITPAKPVQAIVSRVGDGDDAGAASLTVQNKKLLGDAPACDSCGHITIRNGTCYKCLNCGNSMGCS